MSKFQEVTRDITAELLAMAKTYPVVTLLGPRQSGKTTLVRTVFKQKTYISLENLDEREFAISDPRRFLQQLPNGAILDEIQRAPQLLSYLQGLVDEIKINGLFILTGSHQLELHEAISQSLAGRTAILKLLPFSLSELKTTNLDYTLDQYLLTGMYPRIYQNNINPTKFYRDYVQTYIERDVRKMINVKDLNLFQKFIKLCAGRVGQVFNSNNISNELGISHTTVAHWLSILEASFLVFRLQPYFENFGKRVIKSPKLYFADVGLCSYLLDIFTIEQMARDPLRGELFENFVITELFKNKLNSGYVPNYYYYRDSNNKEIDVVFKSGNNLIPIEIKSSQTFNGHFLTSLNYFKNLVGDRCNNGYLIYSGKREQTIDIFSIINFININDDPNLGITQSL